MYIIIITFRGGTYIIVLALSPKSHFVATLCSFHLPATMASVDSVASDLHDAITFAIANGTAQMARVDAIASVLVALGPAGTFTSSYGPFVSGLRTSPECPKGCNTGFITMPWKVYSFLSEQAGFGSLLPPGTVIDTKSYGTVVITFSMNGPADLTFDGKNFHGAPGATFKTQHFVEDIIGKNLLHWTLLLETMPQSEEEDTFAIKKKLTTVSYNHLQIAELLAVRTIVQKDIEDVFSLFFVPTKKQAEVLAFASGYLSD